tara:strand:- start:1260 stop:1457 length:198 start_codon:yes stop_codon:yes gene_type:complete
MSSAIVAHKTSTDCRLMPGMLAIGSFMPLPETTKCGCTKDDFMSEAKLRLRLAGVQRLILGLMFT